MLLLAHCTYGPLRCIFSQIHFVQLDPFKWGAKPMTIKCSKLATDKGKILTLFLVDSILSHWKILSLYFLCTYPTIPHWPTHFVLKLAILLFVLSFNTHSKIPKKKKKNRDNPISLKYLILFINYGAYWNLTFSWAISQYCEHCHYLTTIYSFDSLI